VTRLDSPSARASLARDLRLAATCLVFRALPDAAVGDLVGRLTAAALALCPHPRAGMGTCPDCGAAVAISTTTGGSR
jgi:hypothetical protein